MSLNAERLRSHFYNSNPSWVNGTERFGRLVRKHLSPEMRILDLGAGGGGSHLHFNDGVKTVVGIDPNDVIAGNRYLSFKTLGVAEALPFRAETFDLAYMDWVIEHLPSPDHMAREAFRILKRGGHLLFRTGNILHYSYAISSLTPQSFHDYMARMLFEEDEAHPYPTYYRMNTPWGVRRTMQSAGFVEDQLIMMESDPAYLGMTSATFLMGVAYERLVNRFQALQPFRACILGCFRKPAS